MAKNKKPTKENSEIKKSEIENVDMEKSEELLEVKANKKLSKEEKKQAKEKEQLAKQKKKAKKKNEKVKKNFAKETVSELKKVSWPSFKKACKQTGTVLIVVAVFMLVILGIDSLLSWIIKLIINM